MDFSLILIGLAALVAVVTAASTECPQGYYKKQDKCQTCTECPPNQIIRTQCGRHTDTVCGPFKEFNSFFKHHQPADGRHVMAESPPPFRFPAKPSPIDLKDLLRRRKLVREWAKKIAALKTTRYPNPAKMFKWTLYNRQKNVPPTTETVPFLVNSDEAEWRMEQWQELCFGLIGGLAAVSFLLILYISVSHCRAKRTQKTINTVADSSSIYHRGRIFSRDRLNTTDYKSNLYHLEEQIAENKSRKKWTGNLYSPNRSLLDENHYVDEVFEPNPYQSLETLIGIGQRQVDMQDVRVIANPAPPVPNSPRPSL